MIDDEKSRRFYQIVKYVKANKDKTGDNIVKDFTERQGFDVDMIDIPEEFADLSATDVRPAEYFRKSRRKKILRTKTNRNLDGYDAWRNHDRRVFIHDSKHRATLKLLLAPADLWKVFGQPDMAELGVETTGTYMFEDNNLDMYYLFDYKQTDIYYGLNREDEYYQSPKNLRKPFH